MFGIAFRRALLRRRRMLARLIGSVLRHAVLVAHGPDNDQGDQRKQTLLRGGRARLSQGCVLVGGVGELLKRQLRKRQRRHVAEQLRQFGKIAGQPEGAPCDPCELDGKLGEGLLVLNDAVESDTWSALEDAADQIADMLARMFQPVREEHIRHQPGMRATATAAE
jgi:hypothetical protein